MPTEPLSPDALHLAVDSDVIPFALTTDAPAHDEPVGQDRAVGAVHFAIGIRDNGFNLFCMGPEGTGKASLVRRYVQEAALSQPVPEDLCYVYNFKEAHRPRALHLAAGRARPLARDMEQFVDDLRHAMPLAFEGDDYRSQRKSLEEEFDQLQKRELEPLEREAEEKGVRLVRMPVGIALAPVRDGEVLNQEDFNKLPGEEQARYEKMIAELQKHLEERLRQVPRWEREKRTKIKELDRTVAAAVVKDILAELRERYDDCPGVLSYLDEVLDDILDNIGLFLPDSHGEQQGLPIPLRETADEKLRRYRVNVLVAHDDGGGAPMIEEDHPIQPNLIGRIEHRQQFGALTTDFSLIKPGALHQANGGYLIVEARKLLTYPFAWEDLKRALRKREIRIEAPGGGAFGMMATQTLDPEPMRLDVKVVLLGEPMLYYLLCDLDPDFKELFKVVADFNVRMDRTVENTRDLSLLLAQMARDKSVMPLDRTAVARVIEHGSRLAADNGKLTTHMGNLSDLMVEAQYYAGQAGADVATADHVRAAISGRRRRVDRLPTAMREEIERETIHIATEGTVVGQINALAVLQIGAESFGRPSRVTARARIGRGEVANIERESKLSGPIHSKGVLILTSFLANRYAQEQPLALNAGVVFEQSYGMIDGDSASSTELYAILSALSEIPIRQDLAVTGSVDQFGRVQAIGGVNEKIEAFYDLCATRGLTGKQGVLVPASNAKHLMLREDVVEAARNGQFHVYPVATIDEGMELLTGISAGRQNESGEWQIGTVNRAVSARLAVFSRRARQLRLEDEAEADHRQGHRVVHARRNGFGTDPEAR